MIFKKITNLLFLTIMCFGKISSCFAAATTNDTSMSLGEIIQYGDHSVIVIGTNGSVSVEGIYNTITSIDNNISFKDGASIDLKIDVVEIPQNIDNVVHQLDGCTLTISGIQPHTYDKISLSLLSSGSYNFGFTATFNGTCKAGDYQRTVSIPYYDCSYGAFSGSTCTPTNNNKKANINLSFKITEPLEVSEVKPLNFGQFIVYSPGGTYQYYPGETPSASGSVVPISTPDQSLGEFEVKGIGSRVVNIKIIDTSTTLSYSGDSMTVSNIRASSDSVQLWGYTQNYEATERFYVGGTLTLKPNQTPGVYTGQYKVEVNYVE